MEVSVIFLHYSLQTSHSLEKFLNAQNIVWWLMILVTQFNMRVSTTIWIILLELHSLLLSSSNDIKCRKLSCLTVETIWCWMCLHEVTCTILSVFVTFNDSNRRRYLELDIIVIQDPVIKSWFTILVLNVKPGNYFFSAKSWLWSRQYS